MRIFLQSFSLLYPPLSLYVLYNSAKTLLNVFFFLLVSSYTNPHFAHAICPVYVLVYIYTYIYLYLIRTQIARGTRKFLAIPLADT